MKKNKLITTFMLTLSVLFAETKIYAGGDGHGGLPICKDMHIEASEEWAPGKTISYSINYSEKGPTASQQWEVTGGSIIAVNGRSLITTQMIYSGTQFGVTKYISGSDPQIEIKNPLDPIGPVSSSVYAVLYGVAKEALFPDPVGSESYVTITVKWDYGSTASISCDSYAMGISGVCGKGSEKLNYDASCVQYPVIFNTSQTIVPTCANGGLFQFAINNVPNTSVQWIFPPSWNISEINGVSVIGKGNNVSGQNYFLIRGRVLYNGDPSVYTGTAFLTLNRPCNNGSVNLSHTFPGESSFARSITPSSLAICPYKEVTVPVTISASEGVGPYTYEWSKSNAGCGVDNGFGCASMTYTSTEIMNENINVKITDGKGCYVYVKVPYVKLDPNTEWQAYEIFNNFAPEALAIDVIASSDFSQHTDIVTDQIGLPYYTAQDGRIYTYQYVTTPYIGWKNMPISTISGTNGPAQGPMAIYEPTAGNKTIYFLNVDRRISRVVSTGGAWTTGIVPGTSLVSRSIKVNSSNQLFYINTNNKIFSSINNYASPLATVLAGTKMTITDRYVYYFNTNGQLNAVDYTVTPYTPIGFTNANADSKILSAYNLTYFAWQTYSDIDVDVAGNVYYVGMNNALYQANASTNSLIKISSTIKYNGFLGVGKQAGVVYAGSLNNNIYQFASVNGDSPVEISYVYGRKDWSIGSSSWSGWWRQSGAIKFRAPNVFYLSGDGRLKMVSYNTGNYCTPNILREANEPIEPETQATMNELSDAYHFSVQPNPLVTSTAFNYQLNSTSDVKIVLYNTMGELVSNVIDIKHQEAGSYTYSYTNQGLPTGLYICQLYVNGEKRQQLKLLVN